MVSHHIARSISWSAHIARFAMLWLKYGDDAAGCWLPPLTVAATGRLCNLIEPRHCAPHSPEIDVYTGLDQ